MMKRNLCKHLIIRFTYAVLIKLIYSIKNIGNSQHNRLIALLWNCCKHKNIALINAVSLIYKTINIILLSIRYHNRITICKNILVCRSEHIIDTNLFKNSISSVLWKEKVDKHNILTRKNCTKHINYPSVRSRTI